MHKWPLKMSFNLLWVSMSYILRIALISNMLLRLPALLMRPSHQRKKIRGYFYSSVLFLNVYFIICLTSDQWFYKVSN